MSWKKISLVCTGLLAISLVLNVLMISGCFGPQTLVRGKDALIERFAKEITELKEEKARFKEALGRLEAKLQEYSQTHAWAAQELERILNEYDRLTPP